MSSKLFVPAPHNKPERGVLVGGIYSTPYTHILGYYKAAGILGTSALEQEEDLKNDLFFPICFNYRHYVELSLKNLLEQARRLCRCSCENADEVCGDLTRETESRLHGHSLQSLLDLFIRWFDLLTDREFDDTVRRTIAQLHAIDPDGQNFRYVSRVNGKLALPPTQNELFRIYDLENVRRRMERVYQYLSGIDRWLYESINLALDFASNDCEFFGYKIDSSPFF